MPVQNRMHEPPHWWYVNPVDAMGWAHTRGFPWNAEAALQSHNEQRRGRRAFLSRTWPAALSSHRREASDTAVTRPATPRGAHAAHGIQPIHVECYAGYKADEEPRVVVLDGVRRQVLGIADRWYDPDAAYFKVRADDGYQYLLRRDLEGGTWSLVEVFPADA